MCVQGGRVQLLNIPVCHDPAHDGRTEAAHYNATLLNCARCGGTYQVQGTQAEIMHLQFFIVLKIFPPASLTTSACRRVAWRVRRRGWSAARPRGGRSCECGRGCWPPSAWATPAATPGSSDTTAASAEGTQ